VEFSKLGHAQKKQTPNQFLSSVVFSRLGHVQKNQIQKWFGSGVQFPNLGHVQKNKPQLGCVQVLEIEFSEVGHARNVLDGLDIHLDLAWVKKSKNK
jgi:hypothetical protein